MPDLNDVLFDAIRTSTGDDVRPEVQSDTDNDLLKAMLHFLTVMLERVTNKSDISTTTGVVPFVS